MFNLEIRNTQKKIDNAQAFIERATIEKEELEKESDEKTKELEQLKNNLEEKINEITQARIKNDLIKNEINLLSEELEAKKNNLNTIINKKPESLEIINKILSLVSQVEIFANKSELKSLLEKLKIEKKNLEDEEVLKILGLRKSILEAFENKQKDKAQNGIELRLEEIKSDMKKVKFFYFFKKKLEELNMVGKVEDLKNHLNEISSQLNRISLKPKEEPKVVIEKEIISPNLIQHIEEIPKIKSEISDYNIKMNEIKNNLNSMESKIENVLETIKNQNNEYSEIMSNLNLLVNF
jgi:DNA repair exonuclease SbcCD ATPase subunit